MSAPLRPSGGRPIRLSIVNDYEIVVRGLEAMLAPFSRRVEVVDVEAGGLPDSPSDIALFDTFAGRRHALTRVDAMAQDGAIGKVVLYTWDVPPEFSTDIGERAVDAVILKSTTGVELVDALERVHRGEQVGVADERRSVDEAALTERETEVLALLAQGCSNREIGNELYLSVDTVKTHVRNVFTKLDVHNRTQAALVAVDRQLTRRSESRSS